MSILWKISTTESALSKVALSDLLKLLSVKDNFLEIFWEFNKTVFQ